MSRRLGWWVGLALLAAAVYCTNLGDLFVSDDFSLVRAVRDGGPFAVWSGPHGAAPQFFRPLVSLSFYIDYRVWGIRAFGYHVTNLAFHVINAFIVWRIAGSLLRDRPAAVAAAILFVVLPVHAESVTWISGRTDVIAATFGLGAFAAYLRYVETGKRSHFAITLALLIIGLTAKESVIAVPLVMLCHALVAAGDGKRRGVRLALVGCAAIVPYLGVRRLAVGEWIGGYGSAAHLNHDPRFIARNVCAYLIHILGFGLSPHGFGAWPAIIRLATLALALIFGLVLAFCLVDRARQRAFPGVTLAFLSIAFFVTILPSINLAVDANGTEGERYLYLSSAWFALLLAALLRPARERPARIAALVALLAASATALVARNHDWQRASRLCRNVLDDLHAAPPRDALYVLDMPDDIHDAYVFRNAIWDALALLYPDTSWPPIYVVSVRRLLAPAHSAAHIVRAGDELTVTLADDGDGLEYWNPPAPDAYSLVAHTPRTFTARIHSRGNIGYYQFANDHLQPLNE